MKLARKYHTHESHHVHLSQMLASWIPHKTIYCFECHHWNPLKLGDKLLNHLPQIIYLELLLLDEDLMVTTGRAKDARRHVKALGSAKTDSLRCIDMTVCDALTFLYKLRLQCL